MQKVLDVSEEMAKHIEAKRNWVRNHYEPESTSKYDTVSGKLRLLDAILQSDWIDKNETVKLQSLGITLGDIIIQDNYGFVWVEVEDEYGNDPALQLADTTLILYPMTMISKRIEAGETVNIYDFYEGLITHINEIKKEVD